MATAEQLRALRKKHHLGEFRRGFQKSHSIKHKRGVKMAKRKARRHSRNSGFGGSSIMATAVGVGGYILYEALLEPKVASVIGNGMILNVAELVAGVWLSKKSGMLGNIGKAAIVINAYQIIQPLLSGIGTSTSIFN